MRKNTKHTVPPLTEKEADELKEITRKRNAPQYLVERAKIILLGDSGLNITQTGKHLKIALNTVRLWRKSWNERQGCPAIERLADLPRSGAPAKYTPEQICAIIALSCEDPKKFDRPITHWTQQELANEAVRQGIVDQISQRSVGRFLKSGKYKTSSDPLLADSKRRSRKTREDKRYLCNL